MIKAIIFDVGNTYCDGTITDFMNKSYKVLGIEKVFKTDEEIILDEDYNKGKISIQKCFRKIFNVPISDIQMNKIIDFWKNTWEPTKKMLALVNKLKRNYMLAILSNSDPVNSRKYYKEGWYDLFDVIVLSHEVGIIKPDRRIYGLTLQKLNFNPQQCLFIDDQKKCLETATEMGIKTILYKNLKLLKKEFDKLNIIY